MNKRGKVLALGLVLALCVAFAGIPTASAGDYQSLKGVDTMKVVFDMRDANLKTAAIHLKLILDTFHDAAVRKISDQPDFVVIFMGASVNLLNTNRDGLSVDDRALLDGISTIITQMGKDGIKLEVCLVAVQVMNLDPASIMPELTKVDNGWISLIGYETNGYALVPVY